MEGVEFIASEADLLKSFGIWDETCSQIFSFIWTHYFVYNRNGLQWWLEHQQKVIYSLISEHTPHDMSNRNELWRLWTYRHFDFSIMHKLALFGHVLHELFMYYQLLASVTNQLAKRESKWHTQTDSKYILPVYKTSLACINIGYVYIHSWHRKTYKIVNVCLNFFRAAKNLFACVMNFRGPPKQLQKWCIPIAIWQPGF